VGIQELLGGDGGVVGHLLERTGGTLGNDWHSQRHEQRGKCHLVKLKAHPRPDAPEDRVGDGDCVGREPLEPLGREQEDGHDRAATSTPWATRRSAGSSAIQYSGASVMRIGWK